MVSYAILITASMSILSALALIPATIVLFYFGYLYLFVHEYHGGYLLGSLMLYVLGVQGLAVATIDVMLKSMERRLASKRID